jgi:hypothetical protein
MLRACFARTIARIDGRLRAGFLLTLSGKVPMLWIGTALTFVAGLVTLMVLILRRRPVDVRELGCVSHGWIAVHRVDSP